MGRENLTQEHLKECLNYYPGTGIFTWEVRPVGHFGTQKVCNAWNARYPGEEAGSFSSGYRLIAIGDIQRLAHRMVWLWMTGDWPENEIDHINHKRSDNRWVNLRAVTHLENHRNCSMKKNNTSGCTGVSWQRKTKDWRVRVNDYGKSIELGSFTDLFEACCVRRSTQNRLGYHANHGRANTL